MLNGRTLQRARVTSCIMAALRLFVIGAVAAVAATVFMARKDPTDHYAALGVDRRATKDEIRAAYKQAALKFHPDKCASKRGLWHALLGGAERCARRFHAASAAEEVLSDDAKRIEYDVELARIEFERNARRQRHRAYGGGGSPPPDWFRPGLLVYYVLVACVGLVIWTYAVAPVLRGAKRAVEPKQTAADRSAASMAAVRRQQEALSAAPRRPARRRGARSGRTAPSARRARHRASAAPPAGRRPPAHAGPPTAAPAAARGAAPARRGRGTRVGGGRSEEGPERDGRRLRAVARGRPAEGRTARRRGR